MIPRHVEGSLRRRLADFPAVALVGPRQCGKTTLARAMDGAYFDLEQNTDRLRLDLEWPALTAGQRLLVLDKLSMKSTFCSSVRASAGPSR